MKYTYKRKVSDNYDAWEDCKINNLKKGDIFYMMKGSLESPYLTAISNAALRPSSDNSKIVWHVRTEIMRDSDFS